MSAAVKFTGDRLGRHYVARIEPSEETRGSCATCGGPTRRSWRTGILHSSCFGCRYLIMLYGPNIRVTRPT